MEMKNTKDKTEIIDETRALRIVQQSLNVPMTYAGIRYLASCLALVMENEDRFFCLQKSVFAPAARRYGVKTHCIERGIRTVILHCWAGGAVPPLQEMVPFSLKTIPTVGELLSLLYQYAVPENRI